MSVRWRSTPPRGASSLALELSKLQAIGSAQASLANLLGAHGLGVLGFVEFGHHLGGGRLEEWG